MKPDAMDYVRDALSNGKASGLDLDDVIEAARHAKTVEAFNRAVNILGETRHADS